MSNLSCPDGGIAEDPYSYSRLLKHRCEWSQLDELTDFLNKNDDIKDYKDIEKVFLLIKLAIPVISNLVDILTIAYKDSSFINLTTVNFILDTIKFIKTGEREISITAWESLLSNNDGVLIEINRMQRDELKRKILSVKTIHDPKDTFILWCSKDNGFHDMLCTMNILFKDSHNYEGGRPLNDSRIHVKF